VIEQVVAETLRRHHTQGWLVGGTVRDRQVGRFSPDLDIVVDDDPRLVAEEIAASLGSPWFALSTRHGAFRVMAAQGHVDVAALQGSGIEEDLGRRDFTVNAMAVPLPGGGLLDPFGGSMHLRQRRLVAVSDRIFRDDPLRLMRAARFCHVLGMHLEPALEGLLRREAGLVRQAAGERITTEMVLTLAEGRSAAAARLWSDLGLLAAVLPEARPVGDFAALARLDGFLALPRLVLAPDTVGTLVERLNRPVDGVFTRRVALRLVGLLGRLTHQEVTAVGRRLKLSGPVMSLLKTAAVCLVPDICSMDGLCAAARPGRPLISFLWAAEPWEPEILLLAAAIVSTGPARLEDHRSDLCIVPAPVRILFTAWAEREVHGVSPAPLDGNDLMALLGLAPGPVLGRTLREVRLAWEAGEASTREELVQSARTALQDNHGIAARPLTAGTGDVG
jgi:hypothetical protein